MIASRIAALWPLSALASWALAWAVLQVSGAVGLSVALAALCGAAHRRRWRQILVALGWPLALSLAAFPIPAGLWLAVLMVLALAYPVHLWRDAPLFHTPPDALQVLGTHLALRPGARVLDAGSGLGAGLRALHAAFPHARVEGIEASPLLWLWSRWRCRFARIQRGDLWQVDWRPYELVYIFQRPESMPAALDKARAELSPGAWLASLDFPLPGQQPAATWPAGRHRLFLYAVDALK